MENGTLLGERQGFRAWDIAETPDGPRLRSQGYGGSGSSGIWTPGEVQTARCARGNNHRAPDEGCTCGFYCASSRSHLVSLNKYHRYDLRGTRSVVGTVYMDGKVLVHTLGFRAENIWPVEILVPYTEWKLANDLQAAYGEWGVTVALDNTLRAGKRFTPEYDPVAYCHCGRQLLGGECPRHKPKPKSK